MRKEFEAEEEEANRIITQAIGREDTIQVDRERMAASRHTDEGRETTKASARSRRSSGGR